MKVNAEGVVILNEVKDLPGTCGKILHCVQNDTAISVSFATMIKYAEFYR